MTTQPRSRRRPDDDDVPSQPPRRPGRAARGRDRRPAPAPARAGAGARSARSARGNSRRDRRACPGGRPGARAARRADRRRRGGGGGMTQAVLVTGATDGLGKAVSIELARAGATVLVHGRTRDPAEAAVAEIRAASGSELLRACVGDLASLAQVRSLAETVAASEPQLDVLVNNAGIGTVEPGGGARVESADGHELRFAVNYLAPFLLTRLLEPLLLRSAPARIV